jgi:hypothetical protein
MHAFKAALKRISENTPVAKTGRPMASEFGADIGSTSPVSLPINSPIGAPGPISGSSGVNSYAFPTSTYGVSLPASTPEDEDTPSAPPLGVSPVPAPPPSTNQYSPWYGSFFGKDRKKESSFGATIDPSLDPTSGVPAELSSLADATTGQEVFPSITPYSSYYPPPSQPTADPPPVGSASFVNPDGNGASAPAAVPSWNMYGQPQGPSVIGRLPTGGGVSVPRASATSFGGPSNVVAIAGKPSEGLIPPAMPTQPSFIQNHPGLAIAGGAAALGGLALVGAILEGIFYGAVAGTGYRVFKAVER